METREATSLNERLTVIGLSNNDLETLRNEGAIECVVSDYHRIAIMGEESWFKFLAQAGEDGESA